MSQRAWVRLLARRACVVCQPPPFSADFLESLPYPPAFVLFPSPPLHFHTSVSPCAALKYCREEGGSPSSPAPVLAAAAWPFSCYSLASPPHPHHFPYFPFAHDTLSTTHTDTLTNQQAHPHHRTPCRPLPIPKTWSRQTGWRKRSSRRRRRMMACLAQCCKRVSRGKASTATTTHTAGRIVSSWTRGSQGGRSAWKVDIRCSRLSFLSLPSLPPSFPPHHFKVPLTVMATKPLV